LLTQADHACNSRRFRRGLSIIRAHLQVCIEFFLCRRDAYFQERKKQKKAARKEEQAAKNARKRAEFDTLPAEEQAARREAAKQASEQRTAAQAALKSRLQAADASGPRLIVDLDFWDLMTEQEHKSIVCQLAFSVGHNKRAAKPCSLHFTRSEPCRLASATFSVPACSMCFLATSHVLHARCASQLAACIPMTCTARQCTVYKLAILCSFAGPIAEATSRQHPGSEHWHATFHEQPISTALQDLDGLTYLTADAEDEIQHLEDCKGYIIGGLVDRNRHKRLCLDKAQRLGVHAARLPISEHLQLAGSKV
jgi:tRNA (Guanine-1)-methyltransferase